LAFPVFVIVVVSELLPPTCAFPKLRLAGDALRVCVAVVPVPVRLIVSCAGEPLVVRVTDPLDEVADVGVNTALKFRAPPAVIVVEVLIPETLKPDPVTLTCEKVRVELPVFVIVITLELLFPTTTLPKLTLVGLTESRACRPVPLKEIVSGEFVASLTIVNVPVAFPADGGAN
jgi:hypothetical protein